MKYNRNRFPMQPGKGKCRGCHGDVPKGRSTWCSNKCFDTFEPSRVRWFCKQRDKCVCHHCGTNTQKTKQRFEDARHWKMPQQYRYLIGGVFQTEKYNRAIEIARRHERRWREAARKRIDRMQSEGWPDIWRSWWEMDHVIPFSEGGLTVLENVQTLCCLCHRKKSKQQAGERAAKKRLDKFGCSVRDVELKSGIYSESRTMERESNFHERVMAVKSTGAQTDYE